MSISALPSDILILILENISIHDLAAFSSTCKKIYHLIEEFGWSRHLQLHPRPSWSLSQSIASWSHKSLARYHALTDKAWSRCDFIARPLSRPWSGKLQPLLAINNSRLVVAAGSNIYCYKFGFADEGASPSMHLEATFSLLDFDTPNNDITALSFVDDGGLTETLCVAFQVGTMEYVTLHYDEDRLSFSRKEFNPNSLQSADFIEHFSSARNSLLSLSASGIATLSVNNDIDASSTIELKTRSWISHLTLNSSTPYAAFGTSSATPLTIYPFSNAQLSSQPSAILHTHKATQNMILSQSAVYGLAKAPIGSPWGASPQVLVSGWFDGIVRCYDLRSSSRLAPLNEQTLSPLKPVLTMSNPWLDEPIYSVSCGGGSAAHVAAGSARHSVISFWDTRFPSSGWSVHAPGNDPSPVYSVVLESSRCFGVTQSRPFVYDFGPDVTPETYPSIPQNRDGLKRKKGSNQATCYVTTYPHTTNDYNTTPYEY